MKFLGLALAALVCAFAVAPSKSDAATIRIDFSISSFDAEFNGVVQSTGDLTLSVFADTETPNLGASFDKFKNRYEADAFVTAADLGLNNERIASETYLYFGGSVIGITDQISYFGSIISVAGGSNLQFGTLYDLSTLVIPQATIQKSASEFNNELGWTFENGDVFNAGGANQQTTRSPGDSSIQVTAIQVTQLTAVPLPAGVLLLLSGLGAMGIARRKLRAA